MIDIKEQVLAWIATGRVGASSKTMAMAACGLPHECDYPHDPDDLNRCLLMLKTCPSVRDHFDKIAAISKTFGKLIARWDEIERAFLDEAGLNWCKAKSAPKTYALMKEITSGGDEWLEIAPGMSVRLK